MISTGGTIEAAVKALLAAGCTPEISVVAAHGLFAGPAVERLLALPIRRFITTDSLPLVRELPLPLQVVHLGALLATVIKRLQSNQSLRELRAPR
jgi:ribose-phosphate pyrophosphokinase